MSKPPFDPADDGAQMSMQRDMSYGDYLALDNILSAQRPLSDAHDEMLFIIQHQTSELWMRLAIHELAAAREAIRRDNLSPAFKMLARVSRIFEQLNNAWDVLRTMTPSEYTHFRESLGVSSGLQSHQYRQIEFILGNRNRAMMKMHRHNHSVNQLLEQELQQPSLYHEAIAYLLRHDLKPDSEIAQTDSTTPHTLCEGIESLWRKVYEDPERYWSEYELAEKLVDLEDYFRRWRFNHVTTVERVIGFKRGSGGTSGVSYLRKMLGVELFPELWHLRGAL
jgi:tryptophan 2,3-dioxygenase